MYAYVFILVAVFCFVGAVQADEFGTRFSNDTPLALQEYVEPVEEMFDPNAIEPAAGDDMDYMQEQNHNIITIRNNEHRVHRVNPEKIDIEHKNKQDQN